MHKIGQCIIDRRTKQAFEIVSVWSFPPHVAAVECLNINQERNTIFIRFEELAKHYKVLTSSKEMVRLLYSIRAKAVTNGKPTEP